jgi:DNA-binding MarR family transcriptional regulator
MSKNLREGDDLPPAAYLLKHVQSELRFAMDAALRPLGLTSSKVAILSVLHSQPGLSNAELARLAFVTPQTMIPLLAQLEKDALVSRTPNPDGGRAMLARITPSGHRSLQGGWDAVRAVEDRMMHSLSSQDRSKLRSLLLECLQSLRQRR